jgi:DNA-directed RNA polymerase specialized sigma24 family protein
MNEAPGSITRRQVHHMTASELAGACREQTRRFLSDQASDDTFGLELWRRAIEERDQFAWEALMTQYRGLVIASIRRHPLAHMAYDDVDDWVCRVFERFWRAIDAGRFSSFSDIAAVMGYLKMCAHSVLTDAARSRRSDREAPLSDAIAAPAGGRDLTEQVIGSLVGEQLWQAIQLELQDDAERCLAYLSFVREMRPAEIQTRRPDLFPSNAEVYRVKRNILDRLRRSERIQSFL